MEQKKLVYVVIFVGVLLLVMLGAGMLFFNSPERQEARTTAPAGTPATPSAPATADPSEWVRNPQAVSALQPQTPPAGASNNRGDVIIIYGERPNTTIASPAEASAATVDADGNLQVLVPAPPETLIPTPPPPEQRPQAPEAPKNAAKAPAAKPAAVKAPAKAPAATKAPTKIVDDFWIQTGAFSAKARADAAKETLGRKGIASLVETKDVSGKTYYRVRVGPYSSKNEAEYWLTLVKSIEGFDGSYVSQTKARR